MYQIDSWENIMGLGSQAMFFTNAYRAISPGKAFLRQIHNPVYIPEGTERLVIFGNNSMVFATLNAFRYFGREKYPPI